MPDLNKLEALRKAGYKILPTCGTCIHMIAGSNGWGTCNLIDYDHGKHAGTRKASVYESGTCSKHEIRSNDLTNITMSGFNQFRTSQR